MVAPFSVLRDLLNKSDNHMSQLYTHLQSLTQMCLEASGTLPQHTNLRDAKRDCLIAESKNTSSLKKT